MQPLATQFGSGQVLFSMMYFFLFFIWIWLLITVFADIFRSPELSGWGKAMWTLFVIVLPILGVFVYLIARGSKMHQHAVDLAHSEDLAARQYVRGVVGSNPADELTQLVELKNRGVIDDDEFRRLKAKVAS